MSLNAGPTNLDARTFDEVDWDKEELFIVLDSLEQDVVQLHTTVDLVLKYANRVAQR